MSRGKILATVVARCIWYGLHAVAIAAAWIGGAVALGGILAGTIRLFMIGFRFFLP